MMNYVFDTSAFIVMSHYFPERFPTFWERLNGFVAKKRIGSVREVKRELEYGNAKQHLADWVAANGPLFRIPSEDEMNFVAQVFAVRQFQQMVRAKQLLSGTAVADPFVIAAAKVQRACVVSEETERPNSARIPTVCTYFGVQCITVEGFMMREGWTF